MDYNLIPPFIMRESGLKVEEQAEIHVKEQVKMNHSIYSSDINLRIALQLEGIFLVFKTRNLNDEEIAEPGGYDILYLTPDADSWDPNCEAWAEQEYEMLEIDGEILLRTQRTPVQILEENDYFVVSGINAIRISAENYEKCIDGIISSAYVSTPGPGEMDDNFNIQDWQLGTDIVRAGMASTDARLDGKLLDAALSDRMEISKFAMAIGSTTANKGGCELFLADLDELLADIAEVWTETGFTTAGGPKRVTTDMLSNIWTISHEMAVKTIKLTIQLNQEGENTSLARHLGTNDRMLRYRRIKPHFSLTPFSSPRRRIVRGGTLA